MCTRVLEHYGGFDTKEVLPSGLFEPSGKRNTRTPGVRKIPTNSAPGTKYRRALDTENIGTCRIPLIDVVQAYDTAPCSQR